MWAEGGNVYRQAAALRTYDAAPKYAFIFHGVFDPPYVHFHSIWGNNSAVNNLTRTGCFPLELSLPTPPAARAVPGALTAIPSVRTIICTVSPRSHCRNNFHSGMGNFAADRT